MSSTSSIDPILDIQINFSQWEALISSTRDQIQKAVQLVINQIVDHKTQFEVSLVFTDDTTVQKLNKDYRQKDQATNVLSFPQIEKFSAIKEMTPPIMLGDIVLAWETISWEAAAQGKILVHHMIHLIVHGMMHLLGFDHMTDVEADEMEEIEIEILRQLHIPNPYV